MNRVNEIYEYCLADLELLLSTIHSRGRSESYGIKIGYILYNEVKMYQIIAERTFGNESGQGKIKGNTDSSAVEFARFVTMV